MTAVSLGTSCFDILECGKNVLYTPFLFDCKMKDTFKYVAGNMQKAKYNTLQSHVNEILELL